MARIFTSHRICSSFYPAGFGVSKDTRGSSGLLAGVCLLPLVAFALIAVDYTRATQTQASLQQAADAAVLTAAATSGPIERKSEAGLSAFREAFEATDQVAFTPNFSLVPGGVALTVDAHMDTTFLRYIGQPVTQIAVSAHAGAGSALPDIDKRPSVAVTLAVDASVADTSTFPLAPKTLSVLKDTLAPKAQATFQVIPIPSQPKATPISFSQGQWIDLPHAPVDESASSQNAAMPCSSEALRTSVSVPEADNASDITEDITSTLPPIDNTGEPDLMMSHPPIGDLEGILQGLMRDGSDTSRGPDASFGEALAWPQSWNARPSEAHQDLVIVEAAGWNPSFSMASEDKNDLLQTSIVIRAVQPDPSGVNVCAEANPLPVTTDPTSDEPVMRIPAVLPLPIDHKTAKIKAAISKSVQDFSHPANLHIAHKVLIVVTGQQPKDMPDAIRADASQMSQPHGSSHPLISTSEMLYTGSLSETGPLQTPSLIDVSMMAACQSAKEKGIKLYSLHIGEPDDVSAALDLCVGTADHALNFTDENHLKDGLQDVARTIAATLPLASSSSENANRTEVMPRLIR